MTVPGRLTLDDRPAGATNRSRFGHYEMDTVVSSTKGTGGLLVLIDRKSHRYVIELLAHVTQNDVVAALKRMIARKALGKVVSITTDNGFEFLDPNKIKSVVGCKVYYTRAYASWEKAPLRTATDLSAGGIRRERTSASARAPKYTASSASSTQYTANCSTVRPHTSTTRPIPKPRKGEPP